MDGLGRVCTALLAAVDAVVERALGRWDDLAKGSPLAQVR
jgi:hypothetical protein